MSDSRSPKIENIDILDPIGEIRRRAKELWIADGSPNSKTWEDYFHAAEDDLLGGRSEGSVTKRTREYKAPPVIHYAPTEANAEVEIVANQSDNLILSVIAKSVKSLLPDHDCLCLARVLSSHSIILRSGEVFENLRDDDVAPILAELAHEYDSEFLKMHGASDGRKVQRESRVTYWKQRLSALRRADEPLSYTDRNTIARMRMMIASEPRVLEIKFKD